MKGILDALKKGCRITREFFETLLYCLRLSWSASAFYTIIRIVTTILQPISTVLMTLTAKYVIDLLSGGWVPARLEKETAFLVLMLATLCLSLFRAAMQRAEQYCETVHSDLLEKQISLNMMDNSLNADLSLFDNTEYYNRLTAAIRDSSSLSYILWSAISVVSAAITVMATFGVIARQNSLYGLIMLLAAIPSSIAGFRYTKEVYRLGLSQIQQERQKQYYSYVAGDKQYAQEIRLFGIGEWLKAKYFDAWQSMFQERRNVIRKKSIWVCLMEFLPEIVVGLIAFDIGTLIFRQQATIGDYSLYTGLLSQLWSGLYIAIHAVMRIYDDILKIDNVKSIDKIIVPLTASALGIERVRSIEFQNVCFHYPGCDTNVLDNISFRIEAGSHVAFVGTNGSGKSTLIKLMLGLYSPSSGIIRINGKDIKEYDARALRSCYSVYFQEASNYAFTIRDNVAIADIAQGANDERIVDALIASGAYDRQECWDLNRYLSRFFSEDGLELSGGEHQKLALSRAFYRPASVMILDEPSSSLDPEAEHILFQHIERLCQNKTTIFTSHRLTNIILAEEIIVIEQGKVIEQGSLRALLRAGGRFAQLYDYQAQKYINGKEHVDEHGDVCSNP